MASYLRPRRGKKATAEAQNIILKRGEIFFEVPTTGVGTGAGKLKMGDGTTNYKNLPYFMEPGAGGAGIKDLSLANYNALSETERNNGTIYSVEVGDDVQLAAKNIPFDNTGTGLAATNVQAAIISINNTSLGEDENGMTVHEKLDYLINNGGRLQNQTEILGYLINAQGKTAEIFTATENIDAFTIISHQLLSKYKIMVNGTEINNHIVEDNYPITAYYLHTVNYPLKAGDVVSTYNNCGGGTQHIVLKGILSIPV